MKINEDIKYDHVKRKGAFKKLLDSLNKCPSFVIKHQLIMEFLIDELSICCLSGTDVEQSDFYKKAKMLNNKLTELIECGEDDCINNTLRH